METFQVRPQSLHLTLSPSSTCLSAAPAEGWRCLLFERALTQQSVQILLGEVQLLGGWNWRFKACTRQRIEKSRNVLTFQAMVFYAGLLSPNKNTYIWYQQTHSLHLKPRNRNLNYKIHIIFSLFFVGSSSLVQRPVSSDGQWAAATAWTWGTASVESWRRISKGDKNLPNQTNPGIYNPNSRDVQLMSSTNFHYCRQRTPIWSGVLNILLKSWLLFVV